MWALMATLDSLISLLFILFVCLGLKSLLNIWVHITTVPACRNGTLTNVLPHWYAMPQTQDTTPTSSQYTDTWPTCRCAIHWCGTLHWKTQLPVLISWVRPDREILLRPSTHSSERSTLWAATNKSQKTRNKNQETKRFSTFTVSRLRHSETNKKKTLLDSRIKFSAKHVWNSQSTIYLKSHGCVHGLQNEMSLMNFSTMFC